jgi:integrase/recombinase XerD
LASAGRVACFEPATRTQERSELTFESAIEAHQLYLCTERGLSAGYQKTTKRTLERFSCWLLEKDGVAPGLSSVEGLPQYVRRPHLSDYLAVQKARGLAPSTMFNITAALKTFFRFLKVRQLINQDPGEQIAFPKIPATLPQTLNKVEIEQLLSVDLSRRKWPLRDLAILELFYSSGLRSSELTGSTLDNLNISERTIRTTGKGEKTRVVPIGRPACAAIQAYLDGERTRLVRQPTDLVFLAHNGKRLSELQIQKLVEQIAKKAGIKKHVFPHLLRSSFASHLVMGGADVLTVSELLGHADVATTQCYLALDASALRETVARCHPRGK